MSPKRRPSPLALVVLALLAGAGAAAQPTPADAQGHAHHAVRDVSIVVDAVYRPSRVEVTEGEHVRLAFVRRDYTPCTREVVFPGLGIRRELPTNERVVVDLGVLAPGEHEFKCGMNMIRGTVVVRGRS